MDRRELISVLGLAGAGMAAGRPGQAASADAQISIDCAKPLHKIPQTIYGHFIEELGKCIQGGIWRPVKGTEQFLGGVPWDLVDAIKKIRPSLIRYPGGCFADSYHWRDGIGPMAERRPKPNWAWGRFGKTVGPEVSNQFGTDEFILFCREVGAEPMLTANVGQGTPEEAAAWVEYCNGSQSTKWGAERASNGHKQPFNVRYWFVGNEMWNALDGGFTAQRYGERYLEFAKAMRAADPEVKLIASGWNDAANAWNKKVVELTGADADYLSIHSYYPPSLIVVDGELKRRTYYKRTFGGLESFEKSINLGISAIEKWGPQNREIKVTFDEWNLWYYFTEVIQTNYNLRDGLFVASMLNRLQRLADKVPIANLAQMVNCIGIIISDQRGTFLTPSAWAFNLYTQYTYDRFLKPELSPEKTPDLEVSASRSEKGDKLSLFIVNKERYKDINATISLAGFVPDQEAEIALIQHNDPMKYNTFAEPNAITPQIAKTQLTITSQGGKSSFKIQLPAHSINVISFSKI